MKIENNQNNVKMTIFDQNTQFQRKHFPLSYIRNFGIFGNRGIRRMEKTNELDDISTFGYFAPPPLISMQPNTSIHIQKSPV